MVQIDDLEGTSEADRLVGGEPNSLFGRKGVDELFGNGGNDFRQGYDEGTHDTLNGGTNEAEGDTCKFDEKVDTVEACENRIAIPPK